MQKDSKRRNGTSGNTVRMVKNRVLMGAMTMTRRLRRTHTARRARCRGKALGLSGWRHEHLRVVLQVEGGIDDLRGLAQLLVDASVPSEVV